MSENVEQGGQSHARAELDLRVGLYRFYVDCYIKGIAFFLGINSFLLKIAFDSPGERKLVAAIGIAGSLAISVMLVFAFLHAREDKSDFRRLAKASGMMPLSTAPLLALNCTTAIFWVLILAGWIYIGVR
jgi:hypothetical protein